MKKYIRIEEGAYRGADQSGRIFPLVKDYQKKFNQRRRIRHCGDHGATGL